MQMTMSILGHESKNPEKQNHIDTALLTLSKEQFVLNVSTVDEVSFKLLRRIVQMATVVVLWPPLT